MPIYGNIRHAVLVLGRRLAFLHALKKRQIPFVLWDPQAEPDKRPSYPLITCPFPSNVATMQSTLESVVGFSKYSHAVACTEAAVVPAALVREVLGIQTFATRVAVLCHDKLEMKRCLQPKGIALAAFEDGATNRSPAALLKEFGSPLVIKPRDQSGGRGRVYAENEASVAENIGEGKIVETFVDAPEASVECFISEGQIRFCNITRYVQKTHANLVPGNFSDDTKEQILDINRRAVGILGVEKGLTHLEVYLTKTGPLFGEVALRPPGGYIMNLLSAAYEFDSWDAFLCMELGIPYLYPSAASCATGVLIVHPGPGTIRSIEGWDLVQKMDGVTKASLRVHPGDRVAVRMGVGEDIGHVLVRSATSEKVLERLEEIRTTLKINMNDA